MAYKDIDGKYADRILMITYDMIRRLIDWKVVQKYFPDPLLLYSHKKRCQMLLAIADTTSCLGYKFNASDNSQFIISMQYFKNYRFSKSYKYMKACRLNFLLDPFNIYPNFDTVLKAANNSFENTLTSVNISSMTLISEMANNLSERTKDLMEYDDVSIEDEEDIDEAGITAEEKFENIVMSSIECQNLTELANRQHCNFMRCRSNFIRLIFDIQSMMSLAFDDGYNDLQVKLDEFEKKNIIKRCGNVIDAIVREICNAADVECETKSEFDQEYMKIMKTHAIHVKDPRYDFEFEFDLAYEDPIIIRNNAQ